MKRREFITLLGGAAVAWPVAAQTQQATMPVIGLLASTSQRQWSNFVAALHQGLTETGYVEGQNLTIEFRWADGQFDRLPALAADLVRRQVAVLVSTGGTVSALAAKAATTTIPIVFVLGGDPVKSGLVTSMSRPGGNVTGVSFLLNALTGKRLSLLRELVPAATTVGLLVNPKNPNTPFDAKDVQDAAGTLGQQIHVVNVSAESEIDAAFVTITQQRIAALFVLPDPLFVNRRDLIIALAGRHSVPAMYFAREFVSAGGLMSYSASFTDAHRQGGIYVGRILKGEKPADLPVIQPTKFELAINLKTAKALGLSIPPTLLALADEVIE